MCFFINPLKQDNTLFKAITVFNSEVIGLNKHFWILEALNYFAAYIIE